MQDLSWWKHAVVYQVYPRSFQDSNDDGIGDLNGIRNRLDYLVELGIDAIWISPIYPSPMADFGYDIADYCGIDPIFGTMDDFDRLLEAVHQRGLRLILDFVPNHTSDRHPWFVESRSSRTNPKRDWYIWRDQPNNWQSHFGGSAWEFDEKTGQYYLHEFLREQPDLDWRNPAVKAAMFDALRFWLRKGVDGFRVDVMWLMIKDGQFRDNPPNPAYTIGQGSRAQFLPIYDADRPEIHELVAEMRGVLEEFGDRVLIGEIYLPIPRLMDYYGPSLGGANLPFNFQLLQCAWTADELARTIGEYMSALPAGAWPNWVLGNHDKSRIATRIGLSRARAAALLLMSLPGTLTIYNGEELGMQDVAIPADDVQDPAEKRQPGIGMGRDPERTPMPWDGSPLCGFTPARPWLPIGDANRAVNVTDSRMNPDSMLSLYQRLLRLRRDESTLVSGKLTELSAMDGVLRFLRSDTRARFRVCINLSDEPSEIACEDGVIAAATSARREGVRVTGSLIVAPAEAVTVKLADSSDPVGAASA
ncbi:alpha-amylase family glycosyl hydrolase [Occallatibacter savannae]|uniref:alpha-amylase family glycosyl hydrolase n=1 Tax=Occallatibacter savannae TaxID=1002691 RepID=UPI000D690E93|nr:alpha-amylase family glycosyl hydrolase [Occallatibacter savannae]